MRIPQLTVTRGLPGSGKTTWAKQQTGAVRVNRDELRAMLRRPWPHGDRALEGVVTRMQLAGIEAALRAGQDVICDDTNLDLAWVRELEQLAADCGAGFAVEDFTGVPLTVCLKRDAARLEPVGEKVIRWMHDTYLAGADR